MGRSYKITPSRGNRIRSAFLTRFPQLHSGFPLMQKVLEEIENERFLILVTLDNSTALINIHDKSYIFDSHARNCYGLTDPNGACCLLEFFGPNRRVALLDYFLNQYIPSPGTARTVDLLQAELTALDIEEIPQKMCKIQFCSIQTHQINNSLPLWN